MEKAGSTSIQASMALNAARLERDGIIYPLPVPRVIHHNALAAAYIDASSVRFPRSGRQASPWTRRTFESSAISAGILERIKKAPGVVLSSEYFLRMSVGEVAAFKADLVAAGVEDFRVLGILREPSSFYLSYVQQELKGSSRIDPPTTFLWDYSSGIEAWQANFPVTFFDYSTSAARPRGVLSMFSDELEATFSLTSPAFPKTAPRLNESLSPEEMQLLQDFRRRFYPRADGDLTYLTSLFIRTLTRLRADEVKRPRLKPEAIVTIRERHAAEIARVEALTGIKLESDSTGGASAETDYSGGYVASILENYDAAASQRLLRRLVWLGLPIVFGEVFGFVRRLLLR